MHAVIQSTDTTRIDASPVAIWSEPDRSQSIRRLATDPTKSQLAIARKNNVVEIIDTNSGKLMHAFKVKGPLQGLHFAENGVIATAQDGTITTLTDAALRTKIWKAPSGVECTSYHEMSGSIAVGCDGTELRVYNVSSGALLFAAKGGKPDEVGLVDLPFNTAVSFLPEDRQRIIVGTAKHKVRLYDPSAGKRPQLDLIAGDARVTALMPETENGCWVGTGSGQLQVLDIRAGKFEGSIRGIAGSIRDLALTTVDSKGVLASVGLDRYLRLHSTSTRHLLGKVYLKSQLHGVEFLPTKLEEDNNKGHKRREISQSAEHGNDHKKNNNNNSRMPAKKSKKANDTQHLHSVS